MVHKLALVAITGITLSAVCLGAGAAIEGQRIGKDFGGVDFAMFDNNRPRCETIAGATANSRDLAWDGSDEVSLAVGGHASYTPGSNDKVHVTGDPQLLAHIRVRAGKIEMDCRGGGDSSDLQVILPGRLFNRFSIAGSGNLVLDKLDQERLRVGVAGSGSIKANGKVTDSEIHIAGSGDVDMGQVATRRSEVHIAGSGDTDIAPTDEAVVHIAGSGDVTLHSSPRSIEQHIAGSGSIRTAQIH